MKRTLLLFSTVAVGIVLAALPALADHSLSIKAAPVLSGRLEGTVLTPDGVPIWVAGNKSGIHVTGASEDGLKTFDVATSTTMGGLYRVDLPPGYYDIGIGQGFVNGISYCPQEIYAVQIKAGERLILNVTMDQGNTLTITGKPVYDTPGDALAIEKARADAEKAAAAAAARQAKAAAAAKKAPATAPVKTDPPSTTVDATKA